MRILATKIVTSVLHACNEKTRLEILTEFYFELVAESLVPLQIQLRHINLIIRVITQRVHEIATESDSSVEAICCDVLLDYLCFKLLFPY